MKPVLIGCEESQAVCIELRNLGVEAYSCDLLPCSGGAPEWHIQDDLFTVIDQLKPQALIAFPPCTHLAASGARHFEQKRQDGRQKQGIDFFMKIVNIPVKYKAIENPVGIMSKLYRKPDQIIQPYYFGDEAQKTTCLWLFNLPRLKHLAAPNLFESEVTHVQKGEFITTKSGKRMPKWYSDAAHKPNQRSKTFPGIARAMATQWAPYFK